MRYYKCQLYRRRLSGVSLATIILLLALVPVAWTLQITASPYVAMVGVAICVAVVVLVWVEAKNRVK